LTLPQLGLRQAAFHANGSPLCNLHGKVMPETHQTNPNDVPVRVIANPAHPAPASGTRGRGPLNVAVPSAVLDHLSILANRGGVTLLRWALALVFLWFGALKVAGHSEVLGLIGATLPWVNPHVFVPVLGCVEVLLGLGLLAGRARRLVLLGLVAHLSGTFLTFIVAPEWMFRGGNPLLLTVDGEFVLKNFVLISAALVLMGLSGSDRRVRPAGRLANPTPDGPHAD
jgi:putative oxidoreductase